jgi:uncharacterized C2H2 Zn-finger protein
MGCTHQGRVEEIRHPKDGRVGVRCPRCGMTAYAGDGLMRSILDALRYAVGLRRKES